MNFQDLKRVEGHKTYLDNAIKRSKKPGKKARKDSERKQNEMRKLQIMEGYINKQMDIILEGFPSFSQLPKFYLELVKTTIDYDELKKSLASLKWLKTRVRQLTRTYYIKSNQAPDISYVHELKKQYIGRLSSLMRQIGPNLVFLEQARKTMRGFPTVKTSMFTVAIAGFPNVGKTTLLSKLTGSTPEINEYAFTTKGINVGYIREEGIQLLDTPGTLNRPDRMNAIERQAYLAMEYCANAYVYIFDLTEPYPLEDQEKLLETISRKGRDIMLFVSKSDICDEDKLAEFLQKHDAFSDTESLKKRLVELRNQISP